MRLAQFILDNVEPILAEWEAFARSIWPRAGPEPAELRDDAEAILRITVADMESAQTERQRQDKSEGRGGGGTQSASIDHAARTHGAGRVGSGFDLAAVVAEYRALRATVIRLWRDSHPHPHAQDLEDLTRFNESIDQSLTEAVRSFNDQVHREREALLINEQALRLEAQAANRAKDLFLATLSHEMRTPLNAIVGWVSILRSGRPKPDDLAEGLQVIERSTRAQVQLIDDLLDVSRIISGKLRVEIRPGALCDAIHAAVEAMRPAADARGITLDVRLDPTAGHTSFDFTRIQQVVWNLLSNSVKFTPKGGRIGVTLAREHSVSRIDVRDNGQGIRPDELPYLFDRFRQTDTGTRRRHGGLGLGLSIAKYLVEAHGGTIEANSPGEGRGSTFTIRLPIRAVSLVQEFAPGQLQQETFAGSSSAQSAVVEQAPRADLPLTRLDGVRVLVVDDEADARRLLAKVLEHAGATVTAASSAAEALARLPEARPHVLVSDVGMPGEDGFDLIRQVRARGHGNGSLPAIALTAFAHSDDRRHALEAGFQVHAPKPVDPHELTSIIARLAPDSASPPPAPA